MADYSDYECVYELTTRNLQTLEADICVIMLKLGPEPEMEELKMLKQLLENCTMCTSLAIHKTFLKEKLHGQTTREDQVEDPPGS